MEYTKIKEINRYISKSINPAKMPNTVFEMYSVPAYETGHPEYLYGREIASSKVVVKKNDILLCKINPRINRVWLVLDESDNQNIASSEWIVIRTDEYNPEFLVWYFRTPQFKQKMMSEVTGIGGSLTRAQPKRVAEYLIPVIDRKRQDRIAIVLNKIASIVDLRKKELKAYDELIKSRFVEMFGDYEKNTNSFPVEKLGNLCNVRSSKRIYQSEQCSKGVPFLRISDLSDLIDKASDTSNLYISDEKYTELFEQGLVPSVGDVLITSRGTLGKCYIIKENDRFYFQDGMISWLSNISDKITSLYLSYLFSMPGIQKQIINLQAGSTVAYLSISMLKKLDIMIPPKKMQERFAAFVAQTDKSKVTCKHRAIFKYFRSNCVA